MNQAKRDGAGTPLKIYREGFARFLTFSIVLFVASMPTFSYIVWYDSELGSNYRPLILLVFAFLLWILYMSHRRTYIAIYENGISVQTPLKRFFSSWENLKAFDTGSQRNRGEHPIIITHESVDNLIEHGSEGQKYLPIYVNVPLKAGAVDIEAFAETELGQDLYRFAPQLFE